MPWKLRSVKKVDQLAGNWRHPEARQLHLHWFKHSKRLVYPPRGSQVPDAENRRSEREPKNRPFSFPFTKWKNANIFGTRLDTAKRFLFLESWYHFDQYWSFSKFSDFIVWRANRWKERVVFFPVTVSRF
jgi:hypothetical protein